MAIRGNAIESLDSVRIWFANDTCSKGFKLMNLNYLICYLIRKVVSIKYQRIPFPAQFDMQNFQSKIEG